ncbi:MAG: Tex family protein [Clostridiales bacterium]|nr:Tex family protein [Clostridiales bacterium]
MDIPAKLAEELNIRKEQAEAAVRLIDEGNTIPFIARYRKERTGALNDEILRSLDERLRYLRTLEERKQQVLESIREQGKLTQKLETAIEAAGTLVEVEDLYLPYKKKRKTRAMAAREKGLEPLADLLISQKLTCSAAEAASSYVDIEKNVPDEETALQGACDILAERIAENASYRAFLRDAMRNCGSMVSEAKDSEVKSVYEMYYDYEESVRKIPGHRILALNRGEKEKILNVRVVMDEEPVLRYLERKMIRPGFLQTEELLKNVIADSYRRLLKPALEREIRNELTEKAEKGAIAVFGKNLEALLLQPPIPGQTVMGWDPAFRTGCKLAVVDSTGKVLDTVVIYPTAPQNKVAESKRILRRLIDQYGVTVISLGNGTASRESEQILADFIREIPQNVSYVIVNEAGASVYSASKLATEEFPEYDVGQRSAISIARRLQDPLAELVKIDPASIGVGQYQHDMNQKQLEETLHGVVENCVNRVGVDLNTASVSLLEYVAGVSKTVAGNIVAYREEHGSFRSRQELKKIPKLGPKTFEQCAGFLRVMGGDNPLDATAVHPESYSAAIKLLKKAGIAEKEWGKTGKLNHICYSDSLARELEIGKETLKDILEELEKPGRDPRDQMPKPILRKDVLAMEDLKPGMILNGTVRNVIDFGAFVDIGVHQDGLVHLSQICDRYIRHPMEVLHVGDIVTVRVLEIDLKKKRISLTMKGLE